MQLAPLPLELVPIPAGEFLMGDGGERQRLTLPDFAIGRYPVTEADYHRFTIATRHPLPPHWRDGAPPPFLLRHPVVNVTWTDARAFCAWLDATRGGGVRLPTEAEWEKAARGEYGNPYPWGPRFDASCCNTWEAGGARTTPVDALPGGASPYHVMDMAGNVWEWTSSRFASLPYNQSDGREQSGGGAWRVLRGGSWYDTAWGVRCSRRVAADPARASPNTGFRIAADRP